MKTAVSLPDALFEQAEKLARRQKVSRSALVQRALEAYIASHTDVTEQINAALDAVGTDVENDVWVRESTQRALRRKH